jgi:glucokinase
VDAPNLPWPGDIPLAAMLGERCGVPCVLGNDANAAALGEWRYGAGRGCEDFLVVTLGTGLGSGIVTGGRLLLGPRGDAGELGHTILVPDGRACTCGRHGCLEAYVSIRGMLATHAELTGGQPPITEVRQLAALAAAGDAPALATFERTAYWLAIGLANCAAIVPPERIVLFGGIARSGDLLLAPLRQHFAAQLLRIHNGTISIHASSLPEDDAALLGASVLTTL